MNSQQIHSHLTNQALKRLNIIKGQLNGLAKMIQNNAYCIDILNQSLAIQNSLKGVDALILKRHLHTHVAHQLQTQPQQTINELLKVFKHARK